MYAWVWEGRKKSAGGGRDRRGWVSKEVEEEEEVEAGGTEREHGGVQVRALREAASQTGLTPSL